MKHYSLGTLTTLIASLLISCPNCFAQNGLPIETAPPTRLTVAPTASSAITMKTLPQANCVLHAEGASDAEHSLKLFADEEGTIRFHVRPSTGADQTARFAVDCEAEGKVSTFPLELRPSSFPTTDMPAPAVEAPETPEERAKSRPEAFVRPALTKDDAMNLAPEELASRGYPMRPDPQGSPDAFASWLRAVTKSSTFVSPRSVAHSEVRHSTRQTTFFGNGTNIWSGYSLWGDANHRLDLVTGTWYVPSVYPETNHQTYSSFWVGLDGNGQNDLWQAGTDQDITDIWGFWNFTTYNAWTEFLPMQPTSQVIPNFTVNPGDEIWMQLYIGNPPGQVSLAGGYGIAQIENLSRSEYTTIYVSRCTAWSFSLWGGLRCVSTLPMSGTTAEWIMERPTIVASNGTQSVPDLADYNWVYMYGAYAGDTTGATLTYLGLSCLGLGPCNQSNDSVEQIFMYNGSDLLSTVHPATGSSMLFFWNNFH